MKHKSSLFLKIALTLVVALVVVLLSWLLTEYYFKKISDPVDKLSAPYEPLTMVNTIFKDVVTLDLMQRTLSTSAEEKGLDSFFNHAEKISESLDSLGVLISNKPAQTKRVEEMKDLLSQKINLFEQYLKLNSNYDNNEDLVNQVKRLTTFINKESALSKPKDFNLIKEVTSVTTTTVESGDSLLPQKRNFWDKLWGRKKDSIKANPTLTHHTQEERVIEVDTQLLKKDNKAITKFGEAISQIESQRNVQLKQLNQKRIQLDITGGQLINQFLLILSEIERDANIDNDANNKAAAEIIDNGLNTNRILLFTFVVLSLVLAALIFNDIAKSNKYRKALILAKEDADNAGQAKQKFLSNMSHEIRTPLQSIIGYTELVQREEDPQNQKQFLKVVHQSSIHLLHIVNEILDYNRINSDKFVITTKAFKALPVVDQVVDIIAIQAQRKQLAFHIDLHKLDNETVLYGDPFRLKQILLNLLNNAVKFTNQGSISLYAQSQKKDQEVILNFTVRDTGIGISKENQTRIFNEFEQAPSEQLAYGSGLGLSIVKALVEMQNGEISLESIEDEGSCFTFSIPYALEAATEEEAKSEIGSLTKVAPQKVWIIDDDPFILELCAEVMKKNKISYTTFHSAKKLLASPVPEDLSYVLMDIRMPEYSGMELVKLMKNKLPKAHGLQFVALTAQVLPEEVGDLFAAGFDALVRKPFVVNDLLSTIGVDLIDEPASKPEDLPEGDQIMLLFKKETNADVAFIEQHNQSENAAPLSEVFHKLASRLSQLGYSNEGRAARIIELQLRKGNYDQEAILSLLQSIKAILV